MRRWTVAEGLWQAKRPKQAHVHLMQPRTGELMHKDGSRHAWLEGGAASRWSSSTMRPASCWWCASGRPSRPRSTRACWASKGSI